MKTVFLKHIVPYLMNIEQQFIHMYPPIVMKWISHSTIKEEQSIYAPNNTYRYLSTSFKLLGILQTKT